MKTARINAFRPLILYSKTIRQDHLITCLGPQVIEKMRTLCK